MLQPASNVLRTAWLARSKARLNRQRTDLCLHLSQVLQESFRISILMMTRSCTLIFSRLVIALLIASLGLLFTSYCCFTPPSGKGRQAEAGFRAATPVSVALEKFHEDRRSYPVHLDELVPRYLPDAAALLVRGKVEPQHSPRASESAGGDGGSSLHQFMYVREANGYRLSFSYTGPGMNTCVFDSRTKQWHSHGYY